MFDSLLTNVIEANDSGTNLHVAAGHAVANLTIQECETVMVESGRVRAESIASKIARASTPIEQQIKNTEYTIKNLRDDVASLLANRALSAMRKRGK